MIAKLIGKIDEINDNELIFNVNNICYRIVVSAILLNNPIVQSDAFLSIFIQQITREDGSTLYGFLTKEEKNIFNELIKINGLGPKFAMNLLSIMKPNEIYTAILNKDEARMTEASGIGKKLATRIIIEMQKVAEKSTHSLELNNFSNVEFSNNVFNDAVNALVKLGFNKSKIQDIASQIIKNNKETSTENLIKEVLLRING